MKKRNIIIVSIIVVLLVAVGFTINSIVNKERVSITAQEFKTIMEEKGYMVGDATSQFAQYGYVDSAYIGTTNDKKYQIEFYTLSDNEKAIYFYNTNKTIFENSKTGVTSETSTEVKNYSKYTLNSDGKYKVISRVNNTAIYLNVDEQYKDIVKDLLKEIGY